MAPPLTFVVLVSMIKDAYEDVNRHLEDKKENNEKTTKFDRVTEKFVECAWKDVRVGDFVRVKENEFFPADMLLISSTEPEGVCYVETKNLDGETNLKNKNAIETTNEKFANGANLSNLRGCINIEWPNNRIYKFDGNFVLDMKNVANDSELPDITED